MKTSVGSILLFLCLADVHVYSADTILKNNGYENVLVAISDAVPEDPRIIERIKAIFTEGSPCMYRATRFRAFFRSISILVPAKWTSKAEYESASNDETFVKAALRVDEPNPKFGDTPYTLSYSLCGKQALYIHLTPKFITDAEFATKNYGPSGETLVHEWGHFRWGVFDEYLASDLFHVENGEYYTTQCHSSIHGRHCDKKTKEDCNIVEKTGLPDENCRDQEVTTASYMYKQFATCDDFYDDGTLGDKEIVHDKKARNKQNSRCKGMSAWEVMQQSVDFKNNNNPTNANEKLDTTPSFRLIQCDNSAKVVLLFDVSSSMNAGSGTPLRMMRQAANNFILNTIPLGSYVGIVTFSTLPSTKLDITRIQSEDDRQRVAGYIPGTAHGGTQIGNGMQHAINVLAATSRGRKWAKGANVVLMTDGQNGGGVDPLSLITVANELGITFHTIGYSQASDPVLYAIAKGTGGESFFSTNSAVSAALFQAMSAIADIKCGASLTTASSPPVSVVSFASNLVKVKGLHGKFAIDFTIGKDTTITFNYLYQYAVVEVRLEDPDGSVIDKRDSAKYRVDTSNQIIRINIPGTAMKGEWKYTVTSNYDTACLVNVLSKPDGEGEDAEPITVKSWFGDDNNTLASGPAAQTSIFALVSRGYAPVIGLYVTAAISGGIAGQLQTIHVDLQDKGFGIDLEANDGIYSVEFGRFLLNAEGRHSVTILVDNPENTGKIAKYSKASSAPITGTEPDEPVPTYQTVGPIQRVASGGELRVERPSSPTPVDVIPPPQIRDLQLVLLDTKKVEVTLSWTAVGDDVSHSFNTTYDLRIGTFEEISDQFEKSSRIHLEGIPKNAGEQENHKIDMADYSKTATYFLAIRAIDEAGNEGDPSNIISVSMTPPTKFSNGDAIATETSTLLVVLICAGVLILIAVVVGVVCCCRKKKTRTPDRSEGVFNAGLQGPAS